MKALWIRFNLSLSLALKISSEFVLRLCVKLVSGFRFIFLHSFITIGLMGFWSPESESSPIPTMMSQEDRIKALEILGLGTTSKLLSSPSPLGGFSGIELGVGVENISLDDLRRLGYRDSSLDEYNYYSLILGKGLYYDVDIFLNFTPTMQSNSLTVFGGMMRWKFFEMQNFPLAFSFVAHSSGASFSNVVSTHTVGLDFVMSMNMEDLSFYFGGGKTRAIGIFVGGVEGVTDSGKSEQVDLMESHSLFGIMFRFEKFFIDLQVDRYSQSFYSGKIGTRF